MHPPRVFSALVALALLIGLAGPSRPATAQRMATIAQSAPNDRSASAQAAPTVQVRMHPQYGNILTDAQGRTLYRFTRDEPNVSNCYDQCAQTWPPLTLDSGDPTLPEGVGGTLGVITRRDGSRQVTYNGMPLYYYSRDPAPGDTNGQGVGGVWFVVEAAAS